MRVFISCDMEGATGVCHRDHLMAGGQDYEAARRWLTGDVNAAVEGALESGATEFVVADGHATMRNVLLDELHSAARLLAGPAQPRNRPLAQLGALGPDTFDAAFLVGYHTRAGTPGGLLAHTWVGRCVKEIRLNGRPASEAVLNAAILGHFGVPVVLLTGADDCCRQAREELGAALEVAEVKQALGPSAVLTLSLKAAHALIREAAVRAVRTVGAGVRPFEVRRPVQIELDLWRDEMREQALELGGEPLGRLGIRYEGADVIEVVEQVWRALAHTLRDDAAFLK